MRARSIILFAAVAVAMVGTPWTRAQEARPKSPPSPVVASTVASSREEHLRELRQQITGKESLPAEQVFKNVKMLKGMPAGRLLAVMSMGFARSLGVDCTHCHVPDRWESDEVPAKQVARSMWTMTNAINAEHLKRIENLKGPNPTVNCTTCHRGQIVPATNLPEAGTR